jgi:hypothetical protein
LGRTERLQQRNILRRGGNQKALVIAFDDCQYAFISER